MHTEQHQRNQGLTEGPTSDRCQNINDKIMVFSKYSLDIILGLEPTTRSYPILYLIIKSSSTRKPNVSIIIMIEKKLNTFELK